MILYHSRLLFKSDSIRCYFNFLEMCDHGHTAGGCASEITEVLHADEGIEYNLNAMIDKDKVTVLNESIEGSGVMVFKAWHEHLDKTFFVESDVDVGKFILFVFIFLI